MLTESGAEAGVRTRPPLPHSRELLYRIALKPAPRFEYLSPWVERLLGRTAEDFYNHPQLAFDLLLPEHREQVQRMLGAPSSAPERFVLAWRGRGAHVIQTEHEQLGISDSSGHVTTIVGIARHLAGRPPEIGLADPHRMLLEAAALHDREEDVRSKRRLRDLAAHTESARERERRRLARLLHDELGQLFTSIRLELLSAVSEFRKTAVPAQFEVVDRLQNAAGLIDVSISTLRRISTALRPPVLDHLGLVAAVRWEAAAFERRTGIRCRVSVLPGNIELDRDRSTAIYRMVLEAMTNVARHAQAGAVRIALLRRRGAILVKIQDNGRGIRPEESTDPRKMGLLAMGERARRFGGEFRIGPGPRGGTRVLAILPL